MASPYLPESQAQAIPEESVLHHDEIVQSGGIAKESARWMGSCSFLMNKELCEESCWSSQIKDARWSETLEMGE